MENFEYSIQLNDRDWAEFYFVSEECRLIPPALATAEEQILSDPEEGEAEEKKAPLAHPKTSRLSLDDVPSGHLLAEDAFSGSEEETDLGSVSRFLCGSQQAFRPSQPFPSPFSGLPLNPQLPGPATSSVPLSVAEEGGVGTVGWPMDPKTKAEAHITQERDSQEPHPRPETGEKPLVVPTESPEGANDLTLKYPQDHTSLTDSGVCNFPGSTSDPAVSGKVDFPKLSDTVLDPSSLKVSSVLPPTSGDGENPEKEVKGLVRTPFQETHSLSSQEHSVQGTPLLVNRRARTSGKEEEDVLKTERGAEGHSRSLSPDISQEGDQDKVNRVKGCPEVLEEDGSPEPSLEVDRRGSSPPSGKTERRDNGEPCLHLGTAIQPEGESLTKTQENPNLKSNDCSEETLTNMSWPEVYDYFFADDLHEVERPPSQEGRWWKANHDHQSELPEMSGPEMYDYFFSDDLHEVERPPTQERRSWKTNHDHQSEVPEMSGPEMYEYFFSDDLHEVERPPMQERRSWKTNHDHQSKLPEMSGPEMYEYFFQDVDESRIEEETRSQVGPSRTSLRSAHGLVPSSDLEEMPSNMSTDPMGFPEVYEHFFAPHQPQDKSNRRPNILAVPASELGKAVKALTSLVGSPVRFLRSRPKWRGSQAGVMLVSPTLLDGTSPRPENLGVAVFKPERPLQLVLTPRDLCLGFVALASWAVKTSDLHSPDAWKIVLLANFGTLSAIRCFRKQVVMESHHSS